MKKPEVKEEKEIKLDDYLIPEPEMSQKELNEKKIDQKIVDEDTKKNALSEKKVNRLTARTIGSHLEKKIKLEPIKKESNDEIKLTFLHS